MRASSARAASFSSSTLASINCRTIEDVAIFEQVGLISDDLLHADRPLLIPRPRQAQRLVPGRKLNGASTGLLGQHDRQHLQENAVDIVLRLLLGQAEAVDLHAITETAQLLVLHTVALKADLIPQVDEGAHLAHLGDEAHAGIDEERDAADHRRELGLANLAGGPHGVEYRLGNGQRIGQLLHRRRAGLLQMVRADIHRVPFRHLAAGEHHRILDQPHGWCRREYVGAAREILLDDVVLRGAGQRCARNALLVRRGDIERQQPGGRGIDSHRGVHLAERDALEQSTHVADMGDRHADLADLAPRERVVGVISGLCRQIEGDRQPGLPLGKVLSVKLVRGPGGRVTGIGAHQPGRVFLGRLALHRGPRKP